MYRGGGDDQCTKCEPNEYSAAGADECTPCALGYSSAAGAGECSPCDAGTYRGENGTQCDKCGLNEYSTRGADACMTCDPGYSSALGAVSCEACPLGSYRGAADDQQNCMKCPSPSTTVSTGATGCYTCNEGYYFSSFPVGQIRCDNASALAAQCREDDTKCFDQCCLMCERGMNCGDPANNTLQGVAIENGWWRDTLFSDSIYRCEYEGSCEGGLCAEGHEGVACRVCKSGCPKWRIWHGCFTRHPLSTSRSTLLGTWSSSHNRNDRLDFFLVW